MIISIILIVLGVLYLMCGLWLLGIAAFNEGVKQAGLASSIRNEAIAFKLIGSILTATGIAINFSKRLTKLNSQELRGKS